MDSPLTTIGLPIALGIIMFGLGLSLTLADFDRVRQHPRAVVIALACQLLVLPAVCFGLVVALDLPPLLGIGMMLLAASPGGTSANLFSHLFHGDVELNVTLTAINSIVAIFTLPIITNLAIAYFDRQDSVSLQLRKVVEVFAVVLLPVLLGMLGACGGLLDLHVRLRRSVGLRPVAPHRARQGLSQASVRSLANRPSGSTRATRSAKSGRRG
ncbi:bile acid:sodium symporter family protein [Aeromicrobium stalagmiti]|uniref:bile acid:sodium symporter family protein n=1 Tax=Aeromicrobium stalagmiti TaxID=2738988 RepID=UPI001567ECA5|nr:bile acid:sodium symporter [Aeromicrobium stalagmiti]NRQ51481.1 bile acid:sodium symporter family protein [Aeromicrobium stalagmiti]